MVVRSARWVNSNRYRFTAGVRLECDEGPVDRSFERIYVLIGGQLPSTFLHRIGVHTEWKFGTR